MSYYSNIEEINQKHEAEMEEAEKKNQTEIDRLKTFYYIQKHRADILSDYASDRCIDIYELNKKIDAIAAENELLRVKSERLKRITKVLLSVVANCPTKDEFDLEDIFDQRTLDKVNV